MSSHSTASLQLIIPHDGESWSALIQRLTSTKGELLLMLSGHEMQLLERPEVRKELMSVCVKMQSRVRIATKHPAIAAEARKKGIRVLDRTKHVRALLHDHPKLAEAMRQFSPQLWRQQLKTRLQRMGLLSVPKMRIFSLAGISFILFYVVVFRLLPSTDVHIKPRQEAVSQTVNIFLVQSGATVQRSDRVRRMELVPLTSRVKLSSTFDHISKEFIGTSSQLMMTVVNETDEEYALKKGTRFTNQAGMIFRILDHAIVDAQSELDVRAQAEDLDLYGEIIGDRGNVPEGLKWEIPGLSVDERKVVYGENRQPGVGGTTAYRTVLRNEDIDLARRRLEQELLVAAKQSSDEKRVELNADTPNTQYVILDYEELTATTYTGFVLPTAFLGQEVTSVPMEGEIIYTAFAYDAQEILVMLQNELESHVRDGRRLLTHNLTFQDLVAHVIQYDDNLTWVKLTVDLTAAEEYILDPLSPTGAVFAKKLREEIAGVKKDEALRIVRNMPEVESVSIVQWPPWQKTISRLGAHISVIPE